MDHVSMKAMANLGHIERNDGNRQTKNMEETQTKMERQRGKGFKGIRNYKLERED